MGKKMGRPRVAQKHVFMSLWVPVPLKVQIQEAAIRESRPTAALARILLQEALEARGK